MTLGIRVRTCIRSWPVAAVVAVASACGGGIDGPAAFALFDEGDGSATLAASYPSDEHADRGDVVVDGASFELSASYPYSADIVSIHLGKDETTLDAFVPIEFDGHASTARVDASARGTADHETIHGLYDDRTPVADVVDAGGVAAVVPGATARFTVPGDDVLAGVAVQAHRDGDLIWTSSLDATVDVDARTVDVAIPDDVDARALSMTVSFVLRVDDERGAPLDVEVGDDERTSTLTFDVPIAIAR